MTQTKARAIWTKETKHKTKDKMLCSKNQNTQTYTQKFIINVIP